MNFFYGVADTLFKSLCRPLTSEKHRIPAWPRDTNSVSIRAESSIAGIAQFLHQWKFI